MFCLLYSYLLDCFLLCCFQVLSNFPVLSIVELTDSEAESYLSTNLSSISHRVDDGLATGGKQDIPLIKAFFAK